MYRFYFHGIARHTCFNGFVIFNLEGLVTLAAHPTAFEGVQTLTYQYFDFTFCNVMPIGISTHVSIFP